MSSFVQVIKFTPKLKELRIFYCNVSTYCKNLRGFLNKYYKPIKDQNPNLPILVREARSAEPVLYARYEYGKEIKIVLYEKNPEEILDIVNKVGLEKIKNL